MYTGVGNGDDTAVDPFVGAMMSVRDTVGSEESVGLIVGKPVGNLVDGAGVGLGVGDLVGCMLAHMYFPS